VVNLVYLLNHEEGVLGGLDVDSIEGPIEEAKVALSQTHLKKRAAFEEEFPMALVEVLG